MMCVVFLHDASERHFDSENMTRNALKCTISNRKSEKFSEKGCPLPRPLPHLRGNTPSPDPTPLGAFGTSTLCLYVIGVFCPSHLFKKTGSATVVMSPFLIRNGFYKVKAFNCHNGRSRGAVPPPQLSGEEKLGSVLEKNMSNRKVYRKLP